MSSEEAVPDENGAWKEKYYAELFSSKSLVVSYFAFDGENGSENGKFVEIEGDTNANISVVPEYSITYPIVKDESVSTEYEKLDGNHIILALDFGDFRKYAETYCYVTVNIPLRINTRNRQSIETVPNYVKYLSTPGTEYVKDGDNKSFFQRTVDFSEFFNAYFGNTFSEDFYDSIFDCQICEVVVNIKLK